MLSRINFSQLTLVNAFRTEQNRYYIWGRIQSTKSQYNIYTFVTFGICYTAIISMLVLEIIIVYVCSKENTKTHAHTSIHSPSFWFWLCYLGKLYTFPRRKTRNTSTLAAHVILNIDVHTPSSIMFSDLKWLTFPERVFLL